MSESPAKTEYLLLFRGNDWDRDMSPEEIQEVMVKWMAWFDGLVEDGRLKAGQPLKPLGKIVSGKNGHSVSDGPFAESKEAVGGYFLVLVEDGDEAVEIARACPALEYGLKVEVRPVAAMCPMMEKTQSCAARTDA